MVLRPGRSAPGLCTSLSQIDIRRSLNCQSIGDRSTVYTNPNCSSSQVQGNVLNLELELAKWASQRRSVACQPISQASAFLLNGRNLWGKDVARDGPGRFPSP